MLSVGVAIRFAPSEVGQAEYQCLEEAPTGLEAASATVCLTIHKSSPDQLGEFPPVDPGPQPPRPQPYPQDRGALKPNLTCIFISAGVGNLGPFSPSPPHPPTPTTPHPTPPGQRPVSSINLESAHPSPPTQPLPAWRPPFFFLLHLELFPCLFLHLAILLLVISPNMQTWPPHVPA